MTKSKNASRRKFLRTSTLVAGTFATWPLIRSEGRAASPDHTLVFGDIFSDKTDKYIVTGINHFKALAEKYSDGKLKVDVHRGGSLGDQHVLPQKVLQNAIQGCQTSTQNFTPYSETYNVLDFPFLFPSNESFDRLLEHPSTENTALFRDPEQKGFKILKGMWANTGYRWLSTSKNVAQGIRSPDDCENIRVRVTASKIEQQAFALTPASPVSVHAGEIYQAMQQGTTDALNVGLGALTALRIHEVLGAATNLKMSFNAHVSVLNREWFESLPSDVQDAIERAGRETLSYQKVEQRKANDRMIEEWQERGIEIIELNENERAEWLSQVGHQRSEWDEWRERVGTELYEHVLNFSMT